MSSYSAIQTRVNRRVIDLPTAVTAEVPTLVNEAIKRIQKEHNFQVMEALVSAQQTTLATRTLTSVPSTFKEYRDDPYLIDEDTGAVRFLTTVSNRVAALEKFGDQDDGEPQLLLIGEPTSELGARSWEVYPLPDGLSDYANGEYRIYIPYWKYLAALSAAGDTNWFTENAEEYIVHAATAAAFSLDWDTPHETEFLAKAEVYKRRAIKDDKMFRIAGVRTLVPLWRGADQPRVRK